MIRFTVNIHLRSKGLSVLKKAETQFNIRVYLAEKTALCTEVACPSVVNTLLPASCMYCCLVTTFAKSLGPDQVRLYPQHEEQSCTILYICNKKSTHFVIAFAAIDSVRSLVQVMLVTFVKSI